MVWLKLKSTWMQRFGKQTVMVKRSAEELSPELKQELASIAQRLGQQKVSVREVAKGEAVPEQPQIDEKPLN